MNIADEHSSLIQIILVSVDVVHHDALKGDLQTTLTSFWIFIIFINPCPYHSCHCLLPLTLIHVPYFSSKPSHNYLWVGSQASYILITTCRDIFIFRTLLFGLNIHSVICMHSFTTLFILTLYNLYLWHGALSNNGLLLSDGHQKGLGVDQSSQPDLAKVTGSNGGIFQGPILENGDHVVFDPVM